MPVFDCWLVYLIACLCVPLKTDSAQVQKCWMFPYAYNITFHSKLSEYSRVVYKNFIEIADKPYFTEFSVLKEDSLLCRGIQRPI